MVVVLSGELDLYAAPRVKQVLLGTIRAGNSEVICDLSDVSFIDSTALGLMIQARKLLEPRGGALHVVCPNPTIAEPFHIVGLDRLLTLHETREDALATLRRRSGAAPKRGRRRRGGRR